MLYLLCGRGARHQIWQKIEDAIRIGPLPARSVMQGSAAVYTFETVV